MMYIVDTNRWGNIYTLYNLFATPTMYLIFVNKRYDKKKEISRISLIFGVEKLGQN